MSNNEHQRWDQNPVIWQNTHPSGPQQEPWVPPTRPQDGFHWNAQTGQWDPNKPPKKKMSKGAKIGWFIFGGAGLLIVAAALGPNASDTGTTSNPSSVPTVVDNGPTPDPVTTPTNKPTPVEPTKPVEPAKPNLTKSQEQAIGSAQDYLQLKGFSRLGLIQQLSSEYGEGFSKADAIFAVDHIDVDWNEQAVRAAKSYLELKHFSRAGLIQQLESPYGDQFTHAQAVYGVSKSGL